MPADVDASGLSYLVVSAGQAGAEVASRWQAEIRAAAKRVWSHHLDRVSADLTWATEFLEALDRARIGVRIMVAGPELVVLDAARLARDAGALDRELCLHVTEAGTKRINCMHCDADTLAEAALNDTVTCVGCGRELVVYHHASRRHGAYLGNMVNAESVPVARA